MTRAARALVPTLAMAACSILASACRPKTPAAQTNPTPSAMPRPPSRWVRETLARMPLEARAAQMIGVRASGLYQHPDSREFARLRHEVHDLKVGSLVVFDSDVGSLPRVLNRLQALADVPLLVSSDMERGLSF